MARKFETTMGSGHFIWRLEYSETAVLISTWLTVKSRIPPTERWTLDFDWRFFDQGAAVSERHLESINRHCRRIGIDEVWFEETNVSQYVRGGDKETWLHDRQHIREALLSMDSQQRAQYVADARAEMEMLEPAHRSYEQWKAEFRSPCAAPFVPALTDCVAAPAAPAIAAERHPGAEIVPTPSLCDMPRDLALRLLEQTTDAEAKNQLVKMIIASFAGGR